MSYLSLYRRWRPQSFREVVGQKHVVVTLQRAIQQGRLAHAYLFSGPRGTGKTSVARILAKAVNCRLGPTAEPCLSCDSCRAIAAGSSLDVVEMDAASNRGVDEIRQLRENVGLAPVQGNKKVYIIDEVHMLTQEAFNALLKTLEEPPGHVLFVLATTEPHRLPLTIASRCQRFDFRRLSTAEMTDRLAQVAAQEGIGVPAEVLGAVATYAEGSLRDALGLLDQLLAYAPEGVRLEDVWEVLGRAPLEIVGRLAVALSARDAGSVVDIVDAAASQGVDMRQLLRDLGAYLRDVAVMKACGAASPLLYVPPGLVERVTRETAGLEPAWVWGLVGELTRAEGEVRWTDQPRLAVEFVLLRLCLDGTSWVAEPAAASLAEPSAASPPVSTVEPAVSTASPVVPRAEPTPPPGGREATPVLERQAEVARPQAGGPVDLGKLWSEVLATVRRNRRRGNIVAACLQEGKPLGLQGKQFVVGFHPQFAYHREQLEGGFRSMVEEALAQVLGSPYRLVCRELGEAAGTVPDEVPNRGADRTVKEQVEERAEERAEERVVERVAQEFAGLVLDMGREAPR